MPKELTVTTPFGPRTIALADIGAVQKLVGDKTQLHLQNGEQVWCDDNYFKVWKAVVEMSK